VLGALRECLHQALRHQRQIVFLTGEPGLGKTALIDAFLQQATADVPDMRVAHGLGAVSRSGAPGNSA